MPFPVSEGDQYDRRVVRPKLLNQVGDASGEGNVEGDEIVTESYIFVDRTEVEPGEWDFAAFKRDKLVDWTRDDDDFASESVCFHIAVSRFWLAVRRARCVSSVSLG